MLIGKFSVTYFNYILFQINNIKEIQENKRL